MKILFVVYDNGSYINWFPHGLSYLIPNLKKDGHQITIYSQDVYHWEETHLTEYLDKNKFDFVGVGVIAGYYQYSKLLKISEAIDKSKNKPIYILGGHGPSPEPEYFLRKTKADVVVMGEGELTISELVNNKKENWKNIKGISYILDGSFYANEKRDLIKDLDIISFPAWEYFPINYYALSREPGFTNQDRFMPVLSARGCPYTCNFCYRMEKGYRKRSVENIIDEIRILNKQYAINAIEFSDELLMSSVERATEICEGILNSGLKIKWSCSGRLNFAKTKLLELMKRSGCVFINYGIESLDDTVLKNMNKRLTVETIIEGTENTLNANIIPGLNIIFGNIGETKEILMRGVDFLKKYNTTQQFRTIRPVTPYPGSPLYYYAIDNGLLKGAEEFYEKKHLNSDLISVNFTSLTDTEFYMALKEANTELAKDYYGKNLSATTTIINNLYENKSASFRGFRQI
jgi:radical SAM superfamily enzyme YgiQ (UPF0313 family)